MTPISTYEIIQKFYQGYSIGYISHLSSQPRDAIENILRGYMAGILMFTPDDNAADDVNNLGAENE